MFPIFKKELWAYFGTIGAYVVAIAFSLLCSLFLWFFQSEFNIFDLEQASLNSFFVLAPWILIFLIPVLTMRSIASEEENGTLVWLFSKPISVARIVLEKYFAILILVLFTLLPTFIYIYSINQISFPVGNIDMGTIFSGYLGLILISMVFIALGILASALVKNQIVAFVLGVLLCFFSFYGMESIASYDLLGSNDYILQRIGVYEHFSGFSRGVVSLVDIGYFIVVIGGILMIAVELVKRKK